MNTQTALFLAALFTSIAWAIALLLYVARCHLQLNEIRQAVMLSRQGVRADLGGIMERIDRANEQVTPHDAIRRIGVYIDDPRRTGSPGYFCSECGYVVHKDTTTCPHCLHTFSNAAPLASTRAENDGPCDGQPGTIYSAMGALRALEPFVLEDADNRACLPEYVAAIKLMQSVLVAADEGVTPS